MNNNIELVKYFIEEMNVKSFSPNKNIGKTITVNLNNDINFSAMEKDKSFYRVVFNLTVTLEEVKEFKVNIVLTGIFRIDPISIDKKTKDKLLTCTAASVLYGVIREMVQSITLKMPSPPILLPIIDFPEKDLDF